MHIWLGLSAGVVALAGSAVAKEPGYDERTLEVAINQPVALTINGEDAELMVLPDALSVPTLDAALAQRLELEGSLIGFGYVLGGTTLKSGTNVVNLDMGSGRFRRRAGIGTTDSAAVGDGEPEPSALPTPGADGEIGPGGLPFARVLFRLAEARPGEREHRFPMLSWNRSGVGVELAMGEHPLRVTFSFSRAETLAAATAGARIADRHGGYFSGEGRLMPIRFGVDRPVRPLTLGTPLMLGDLEVRNIMVRTGDYGDASRIGEEAQVIDPNEIVVTADSRKGKMPPLWLTLGMDTIGHCSSILYDFEAETVTLTCPD